jgi:hypothetical protein
MKPPSILDPNFKYTPANSTDLRKTFARIRREIERDKQPRKTTVVVPISERKRK